MFGKLIDLPSSSDSWLAGVTCIASGVALVWLCWGELEAAVSLGILFMAIGAVVLVVGMRRSAAKRAFDAEWARAKSEWSDLRKGAADARLHGKSTEDYLRERGYRVTGVVQAIAHDLSSESPGM